MTSDTPPRPPDFEPRWQACEGTLARYCKALLSVRVTREPPVELTVIPHDTFLVSVQVADGQEPLANAAERGLLPHGCGWRERAYSWRPGGGCRGFFALLTPEGAVTLGAGQPLPGGAQPRQPLAHLLPRADLVALEDRLALQDPIDAQLAIFGQWLERLLLRRVHVPWQARRAARIANAIFEGVPRHVDELAAGEGLSQRQLQRDFRRWLNVAPKHATQVARVQAVARLGQQGHALADIAHWLGFVDQSHMNTVVRNIAGVTPRGLVATGRTDLSVALRAANRGGLVYL